MTLKTTRGSLFLLRDFPLARISVFQFQFLRVYHDGFPTDSGYNERVRQGIIPYARCELLVYQTERKTPSFRTGDMRARPCLGLGLGA